MAPKRSSSATAWGSPSDGSDAEGDAGRRRRHHDDPPSDAEGDKTPPPNPNPKSSSAAAAPSSTPSVAADSAAAGSDSGGTYDSDADAHRRPAPRAASPKPGAKPRARSPGINSDSYDSDDSDADARRLPAPKPASPKPGAKPRARSPGINEDSDDSAAPAASDADLDPAAGADSEDDDLSPLRPARHPRAEASIIKPISSRPMDSPPRGGGPSASEPRVKRPRSAAIAAPSPDQQRRPSRLWSHDDELLILRGLATYRAKSGVLPGSTNDIGKLHSHIRSQLSVRVSTTQLSDKVRRLKQKYQVLATRAKNGREQDLHTPHDRSIFEHAKKVWGVLVGSGSADGGGSGYENAAAGDSDEMQYSGDSDYDMESGRDDRYHIKNRKLRPITAANGNGIGLGAVNISANGRGKSEFEKGKDAYPYLWETVEELSREHPSGAAFKKAFEVLEGSKARAIEEKLRKFRLTEIRQQLRRMDLMKDTVRMVLDALENAD